MGKELSKKETELWIEERRQPPRRIFVEGLIGAGKSCLATLLSEHTGYKLLEESVGGNPFLGKFYEDPKRWGFPLQIYMLRSRLSLERAATYEIAAGLCKGAIGDRSLGGDTIFLQVNHLVGNISEEERDLYLNLFEMMKIECPYPDVIVFLDVSLPKVRERIANRGRKMEQGLLEEGNQYLELLDRHYRLFCASMSRHTTVVMLPWDQFLTVEEVWEEVLEKWHSDERSRFDKILYKW